MQRVDRMVDIPKLAVFGCGYWGSNHIRTLAELGALSCVVDVDTERARRLAEQHGALARDAADVFADPEIAGIVMALPAQFHAPTALEAFAAGKHVFAEKPIALGVDDAEAMVRAAANANRILMAGHILRYHKAFDALMKLVNDGTLGHINYIQSHRTAFGRFHAKFDAVWDLAPHDLSLLLSVAGRGPNAISSVPVSVTNGQNDLAHIHLEFDGGLRGHVYVSRHSPYMERRFTVIGDKAMAVWDDMEPDWNKKVSLHRHKTAIENDAWAFSKDDPVFIACDQGMALTDELSHFIECIENDARPKTDGIQGLEVVKILNKIG